MLPADITYRSPYAMQKHNRKFRNIKEGDEFTTEYKIASAMTPSVDKTAVLNEIIARSSEKHGPAANLHEAGLNI